MNVLHETKWVKLKESQNGFQFLERNGVNSIAILLIQKTNSLGWQALIRHQPLIALSEVNDEVLDGCPITGSIDSDSKNYFDVAIKEAFEEAGYVLKQKDLVFLGTYIVGTQTNEECYMFVADVTDKTPTSDGEGDGTYFEAKSFNRWESFENLKDYKYAACPIMYYKIKNLLG